MSAEVLDIEIRNLYKREKYEDISRILIEEIDY